MSLEIILKETRTPIPKKVHPRVLDSISKKMGIAVVGILSQNVDTKPHERLVNNIQLWGKRFLVRFEEMESTALPVNTRISIAEAEVRVDGGRGWLKRWKRRDVREYIENKVMTEGYL